MRATSDGLLALFDEGSVLIGAPVTAEIAGVRRYLEAVVGQPGGGLPASARLPVRERAEC